MGAEQAMIELHANAAEAAPILDDRIRGVPPGARAFPASEIAALHWHPADGVMSLPVLTLDEAAFLHNRDLMLAYARAAGVAIAPHAKTPMAPDLARSLVEAGAWGATIADVRQATVMLRAGISRLLLANEVGGIGGARRLAALACFWPQSELYVFADSPDTIEALDAAWRETESAPPLRVLIEVGAGRAGARSRNKALAVARAVATSQGRLRLAGVATYEGTAAKETPEATDAAIGALLRLVAEVLADVRILAGSETPLIVTAGGSSFFDRVIADLKPATAADGRATLILRSGAIFFNDHGIYDRALTEIDKRRGFLIDGAVGQAQSLFRPALRVWAEVLSRPEPELAICGMGIRDVSFDQGFPTPVCVHRAGRTQPDVSAGRVFKLNDQHAFLSVPADSDLGVGDVVEFGISHPCTCLDRYRFIFGVDENGVVRHAFPTYFG
jgi:D-serine dehydratase